MTQGTAANLKALVDINTGQTVAVTQGTAANLKALVDINTGQSVAANIVNQYSSVAAFNSGGTGGAKDGNIRDTANYNYYFSSTLLGYKIFTIFLRNDLDQTATVSLAAMDNLSLNLLAIVYIDTLAAGASRVLAPFAGGTASALVVVPALAGPLGATPRLRITCAVAPTTGTFNATIRGIT